MKLHELRPAEGAKEEPKEVGRGVTASGWGKTAGKGQKGQKLKIRRWSKTWIEGGQMPLYRRLPKRGLLTYSLKNMLA